MQTQEDVQLLNKTGKNTSSVKSASTKVQLEWKNVRYSVQVQDQTVEILKGLSGFVNPGQLVALMGSSGAGKTSLLNILSNRLATTKGAQITGEITANGYSLNDVSFSSFSAYITQEDTLLGTLTPRESLTFAAYMKVGLQGKQLEDKVSQLLDELQLNVVADNIIGSVLAKGLSGGQIKRVCIAIETITDPSVIFLDEPTSGLDSSMAEVVIQLLTQQAASGRTIICTIHQPSYRIFKLFDRLIFLSDGKTAYQGPTEKVLKHFRKIGYDCPPRVNPADFIIDLLHVSNKNAKTSEEESKIEAILGLYKRKESAV